MKRLIAAAVLAISSVGVAAQQFPAKPIHLVVTFAAGGASSAKTELIDMIRSRPADARPRLAQVGMA
jgi:hypothetical protein